MDDIGRAMVDGLERFAADLASGRLVRYRGFTTTWHFLDEPCPSCGGRLVRSSRFGTNCTARGCRYSWEPQQREGADG